MPNHSEHGYAYGVHQANGSEALRELTEEIMLYGDDLTYKAWREDLKHQVAGIFPISLAVVEEEQSMTDSIYGDSIAMSTKKNTKASELYDVIVERNIPHANHYSDLYIPVTEETREIIKGYKRSGLVTTFINQVEGGLWYDIPFAYTPYWKMSQ